MYVKWHQLIEASLAIRSVHSMTGSNSYNLKVHFLAAFLMKLVLTYKRAVSYAHFCGNLSNLRKELILAMLYHLCMAYKIKGK